MDKSATLLQKSVFCCMVFQKILNCVVTRVKNTIK